MPERRERERSLQWAKSGQRQTRPEKGRGGPFDIRSPLIDQLTLAGDGANEDDDVASVDPDGSAACDVIGEFSGSIERWWSLKGEAASESPPAM